MDRTDGEADRVKTVDTALTILETLQSMGSARVTELADEVGVAKSTAHRHLATLESREYVSQVGDEYRVSLRFLTLGEAARTRDGHATVRPKVRELAERTEERAQFFVEEHRKAVYVYREVGAHAVHAPHATVGTRMPLHTSSGGKALLASYSDERVREILTAEGLPSLTDRTITDEAELFEELERTRERGYAINRQENVDGIRAVGVALTATDGRPMGALSVSGPIHRMNGEWFEEELPELLLGTAKELELNIAYA
ncbi:MAG: IclR family transcriptional regulator [Haloferacaceae archaeon]